MTNTPTAPPRSLATDAGRKAGEAQLIADLVGDFQTVPLLEGDRLHAVASAAAAPLELASAYVQFAFIRAFINAYNLGVERLDRSEVARFLRWFMPELDFADRQAFMRGWVADEITRKGQVR